MIKRLILKIKRRINCIRGKHEWERRQINFELDDQIIYSQQGYVCSVCGRYVRDCDITEANGETR